LEDFKRSEQTVGQIYPVVKDAKGRILDGFHRKRVNSNWKEVTLPINDDVEALRMRVHLNWMRRPIKQKEKKEWVEEAKLILQRKGYRNPTERQIADLLGVNQQTVHNWVSSDKDFVKETYEQPLFNVWGFKKEDWRKLILNADPNQPDVDFYHGSTPSFVIHNLIHLYKPKTVLDSMAGIGTTGYVCKQYDIACDLFDIYPNDQYHVIQGDAEKIETDKHYDLIFNHIPYLDMAHYGESANDLANMKEKDFMVKLTNIFLKNHELLIDNGLYVVLVGDKRFNGKLYPLTAKTTEIGLTTGFDLFDIAIKLTVNQKSSGLQEYRAAKYGHMAQTFDTILIFKK